MVLFFLLVITLSILYLFVGQLDLLDEVKSEFQMSNLSVLTYRDTDGRTGRCGCLFCVQSLISFTITIPRGWVFRLGSFNYDCLFVLCLCLSLAIIVSYPSPTESFWPTSCLVLCHRMTSTQLVVSHFEVVWCRLWMITEFLQVSHRLWPQTIPPS